jgi:hypothetical protein
MRNLAMARKLDRGDAIDVSVFPRTAEGEYVLPADLDVDDKDFCDSKTEEWIWSIGRSITDGSVVLAALDSRFYSNGAFTCIWLR